MQLIKFLPDKVRIKTDNDNLKNIKINDLILLSDDITSLVSMVFSITGNDGVDIYDFEEDYIGETADENIIESSIIGSIVNGKFTKSIDVYPTTDVKIRMLSAEEFSDILSNNGAALFKIGKYSNYDTDAYIDGNKFFQRHSAIIGNTGSGKSFTVTSLLEKVATLKNPNIILFDVHGEYQNLSFCKSVKIGNDGYDFPMWFLPFKDFYSSLLKIKEETSTTIIAALRKCFYSARKNNASENLPIAYNFEDVITFAKTLNSEEIGTGEFFKTGDRAGLEKTIKGDLNGKLNSLISLLEDKLIDSRYAFMTKKHPQNYLYDFINNIYGTSEKSVKIIDLSDVPHDMIPTIIAITAKLIYLVHMQNDRENMNPLTMICDEAHVYIPSSDFGLGAGQRRLLDIFETIAKEGRKFGVTLCIVSQRPSELNRTIMAQCANFIVMKLTNDTDKSMIKNMLPESSKQIMDMVSVFSPGDALVIGDSSNVSLKMKIDKPKECPQSNTINVWERWNIGKDIDTDALVTNLLKEKENR